MDHQNIKSILQEALEEEIPASRIQLWPAVKANLVVGKHNLRKQGENMESSKTQRMPRFAIAVLVIVALLTLVLLTPQGRSLAQSIWQFFVPAESTTFPLKPSQITSGETDATAPTAEAPSPLISIAEAEALAGFDAKELPYVPSGFNYLGARLYGNVINLEYEAQGGGGNLIIKQSRDGFSQLGWDQVPVEAIIPVKIGDLNGEFVQGTFVVYAEETSATWNPDAAFLRLRWRENDVWFEIAKYGNVEVMEYINQEEMIKLAESMTQ